MKDEIKEILDYFREYSTIRENTMISEIENCLINLQEENEKLIAKNLELETLCDKYEEEHKTTFEEWKKDINIIDELEKYINEEIEDYNKALNSKLLSESGKEKYEAEKVCFLDMLDKLNQLKGDNK